MREILETARKRIQKEIALSEGEIPASGAIDRCFINVYEL